MTRILITRLNPRTGRIERPWRNREGVFVLGDPTHGAQKHHDRFAVKVGTLAEVADLVKQGFSLRMTDGETPPSLIAPESLTITEQEGDEGREQWAETLPKAPFSKDDMLTELKRAMLVQASQIAHAGSMEAAIAFIGFGTTNELYPYCEDDADKVDLRRFHASSYMDAAYDYAFQIGCYWAFGDGEAQDLNEFIQGANPRNCFGNGSPLANLDSLCRRAADMAFGRWKLSQGHDLRIRELALLADMKEPAVRNSLSKDRITVQNGEVDSEAASKWLAERRDFIPTRTNEGNKERWANFARTVLQINDLSKAFGQLLKGYPLSEAELAAKAQVSEPFIGALAAGRPTLDLEALRRVGEALDLDAPHFVGVAVQAALRVGASQ
ncbi:MAG: hypothetical protein M0Z28_22465 [Rhodospirillales bacterium]|nr:hypothetical protein [Rhodospirillales bacterium]